MSAALCAFEEERETQFCNFVSARSFFFVVLKANNYQKKERRYVR